MHPADAGAASSDDARWQAGISTADAKILRRLARELAEDALLLREDTTALHAEADQAMRHSQLLCRRAGEHARQRPSRR